MGLSRRLRLRYADRLVGVVVSEFPALAKAFFWVIVAAAAATLGSHANDLQFSWNVSAAAVFALLIVSNILADLHHIHLHSRLEVTLSSAINFAAMLIFGPALAAIGGATGSAISDSFSRKPWYKVVFNACNTVLPIFASGLAYRFLNGDSSVPLATLNNALALFLAGLAYLAVNIGVVNTMVGLVEGHNPLDFARVSYRGFAFQLITLIPLGTLITIVYYQTPWGLALLLFPILLTQHSFKSYHRLRMESQKTIELLADAVDKRDPYTFQHSLRVGNYADRMARRIGLDLEELENIAFAARIHDLGKIGIPSSILLKNGPLTKEERRVIEQHPSIGARIMSRMSTYERVKSLIEFHHERIDGKGYPTGLSGEQIPVGARIIGVADAYEAMTSDRPYRKALSTDRAIRELEKGRGAQFDSQIIDHFLAVLNEEKQVPLATLELDLVASGKEGSA